LSKHTQSIPIANQVLMKTFQRIVLPIAAALAFSVFALLVPVGGPVCMILVAIFTVCGGIFGQRLPLALRVGITGVIIFFAFAMFLAGRAMAPKLTHDTVKMAFTMFGLLASVPVLSLLRLWRFPVALRLISVALPVCFGFAMLTAEIEERLFVQRYRETGIGPTPRWTDSNSWLSYDAQTHQLNGAD
jgi:hypothetical protein